MNQKLNLQVNVSKLENFKSIFGGNFEPGKRISLGEIDLKIKDIEVGSGFIENINVEFILTYSSEIGSTVLSTAIIELLKNGVKKVKINGSPTRIKEKEIIKKIELEHKKNRESDDVQ
ncbi:MULTISPECIES: hypothetical protein [Vibrio]|uniref:hypothetical protein n=1 Tax=Vibrio TaxID=662 RepID=UPI00148363F4|nr:MULTISPECIES: hypothetical protein [Vibrio]MBS9807247.1 hypothetical protein [Vibrio alginolyticus]MCZ2800504.1 hypothetical protein [Vibrio alginolyticus]MDW3056996.1 hypothetical protein [Vibrio sp. 1978]NNN66533.1 hypothetical protein [Vibrio sp. 2-1(7)]